MVPRAGQRPNSRPRKPKERETKKRRDAALAAALAAKERVQETSEDDALAVKGVNTELSSVAAFLKDKKSVRRQVRGPIPWKKCKNRPLVD